MSASMIQLPTAIWVSVDRSLCLVFKVNAKIPSPKPGIHSCSYPREKEENTKLNKAGIAAYFINSRFWKCFKLDFSSPVKLVSVSTSKGMFYNYYVQITASCQTTCNLIKKTWKWQFVT